MTDTKQWTAPKTATIGQKTLHKILDQAQRMLQSNLHRINEAYIDNDDELDIGLKVQLRPAGREGVFVQTTISFVESRVKQSLKEPVDERQLQIFTK